MVTLASEHCSPSYLAESSPPYLCPPNQRGKTKCHSACGSWARHKVKVVSPVTHSKTLDGLVQYQFPWTMKMRQWKFSELIHGQELASHMINKQYSTDHCYCPRLTHHHYYNLFYTGLWHPLGWDRKGFTANSPSVSGPEQNSEQKWHTKT